jgi:nitrogen fixation NifU-like protein
VSDPLYRKELLRLAADAHGAGRLPAPTTTGSAFNPSCGDRVSVVLVLNDGHVTAIALEAKACVLSQASASILGATLNGRDRSEVDQLRKEIVAMLHSSESVPAPPFEGYAAFDGVTDHPARHKCVLLPVEAVLNAFENSESRKPGGVGT